MGTSDLEILALYKNLKAKGCNVERKKSSNRGVRIIMNRPKACSAHNAFPRLTPNFIFVLRILFSAALFHMVPMVSCNTFKKSRKSQNMGCSCIYEPHCIFIITFIAVLR